MEGAIKVLLLALLYVAAFFLVEMLGFFHPFAWTYSAVFIAVVAAWPYFKLCQRFPMPGVAIICAVLLLMCNFLIGEGHEYFAIGCVGFGCLAEVLRKFLGNYRDKKGVITSYAVMSLIPFSMTCVLWVDYEEAMELVISRMGDIWAAVMGRMLSKYMLMSMIVLTLVLAVLTMWILTRNWRPSDKYDGYPRM